MAKLYVIFITLLRFESISAQMLHIMAALPLTWILSDSWQKYRASGGNSSHYVNELKIKDKCTGMEYNVALFNHLQ